MLKPIVIFLLSFGTKKTAHYPVSLQSSKVPSEVSTRETSLKIQYTAHSSHLSPSVLCICSFWIIESVSILQRMNFEKCRNSWPKQELLLWFKGIKEKKPAFYSSSSSSNVVELYRVYANIRG